MASLFSAETMNAHWYFTEWNYKHNLRTYFYIDYLVEEEEEE